MERQDMTGRFAFSKAGHDKDTLYVIVKEDGDFLFLADGKGKTLENPKKKRKKHVQPMNDSVDEEILSKLRTGAKLEPEKIKYALRKKRELLGK